ncbi:MAG: phosphatidylserine decarboxylase family protein [Saprospirales bacterium]|nr:MAG: phosphatidylserine decarboxylase family protein [Saprospirales bacterium]
MAFIHKEGYFPVAVSFFILLFGSGVVYYVEPAFAPIFALLGLIPLGFFLQFFRNPRRVIPIRGEHLVYAPADGKVVAVEDTEEKEYFKDRRIQVSIFMSPVNVHVNRAPISGVIDFFRYHKGKYLVAWHPKSSELNERTTVVIKGENQTILLRQIAGMMAKRIKFYPSEGQKVTQGDQIGFITFGSRVDILLPTDAEVLVKNGDKVLGNEHVIANLSKGVAAD